MVTKNDYDSYFFNSLYNDDLITELLDDYQNHLYDPIMRGKEWIQDNQIINGDAKDIRINQDLNMRFQMPKNAYSLFLNTNIVPFYSEKEFFYKYGYGQPIATTDIINDGKIFSRYIYFFVNGYLIHDVKFVVLKGGFSIIFITPIEGNKIGDLNEVDFNRTYDENFTDNIWTIRFGPRSDLYTVRKQRALLFKDNKIYLSSFATKYKYYKPTQKNAWTAYMTAFNGSYNIMTACNVVVKKDNTGEYFEIPKEFKDYIYTNISMVKCIIVNEPTCGGSGVYINSSETSAIFQIPFEKNPIPIRNLLIWQYDAEKKRKLHPLTPHVTHYYPNIYDFEQMILDSYYVFLRENTKRYVVDKDEKYVLVQPEGGERYHDLYIEWLEPIDDVMEYNSYIQDYIDCYQIQYTEMVINDTLPDEFFRFTPEKPIKLGAFDYFHSEFYGDYRAWRLHGLIEVLKNNPRRYDEFYHIIYSDVRKWLHRDYNYKTHPHIFNRSITTNRDQCNESQELLMNFEKPHSYVRFYDHRDKVYPVNLLVDGKMSKVTYTMKFGSTVYVYFDKELIKNRENIQVEMELMNERTESGQIEFNGSGSATDLELAGFKEEHSLSDLIFYDEEGNYIPNDDFEYIGQIETVDMVYGESDAKDFSSRFKLTLHDKDHNLIVPKDADCIILRCDEVEHPIGNSHQTKKIYLDNVKIKPKKEVASKYVGTKMNIATADFYQEKIFILTDDMSAPILIDKNKDVIRTKNMEVIVLKRKGSNREDGIRPDETYNFTFHNFRGKPGTDRLKIYVDGLLYAPDQYSVEYKGFNNDAVFTFGNEVLNKEIQIQYTGYDDELLYYGPIQGLPHTNDRVIFLRNYLTSPFDPMVYKVYLNGKRVADDKILMLGQSNMIYLDTNYNQSDVIMIYKQRMDSDIYEYSNDVQFLDAIAMRDEKFRLSLLQKYVINRDSL